MKTTIPIMTGFQLAVAAILFLPASNCVYGQFGGLLNPLIDAGKKTLTDTVAAPSQSAEPGASDLLVQTKLPDLAGTPHSLDQLMGANGLQILFIDSTSPQGVATLRELPAMAEKLRKQSIASVVINLDEPADKVKAFYAQVQPGVPVLYDTTTGTRTRWDIKTTPTSLVVGPSATVIYKDHGFSIDMFAILEKSLNMAAGTFQLLDKGVELGKKLDPSSLAPSSGIIPSAIPATRKSGAG